MKKTCKDLKVSVNNVWVMRTQDLEYRVFVTNDKTPDKIYFVSNPKATYNKVELRKEDSLCLCLVDNRCCYSLAQFICQNWDNDKINQLNEFFDCEFVDRDKDCNRVRVKIKHLLQYENELNEIREEMFSF